MTTKTTRKPRKSAEQETQPTYSNVLATCLRDSKVTPSGKTVTYYELKDESVIESWSFADAPHSVTIGQKVLLRVKHMPDGKRFYNIS